MTVDGVNAIYAMLDAANTNIPRAILSTRVVANATKYSTVTAGTMQQLAVRFWSTQA